MSVPDRVFTVSQLTRDIKRTLESQFPPLWMKAEISGVVLHRSGHLYLTFKDEGAQMSGVMWRSRVTRLDFHPEDGMEVLVFGGISLYEKGGRYQFDIEVMQRGGRGALFLEFEKLKKQLQAEGLFDPQRKRLIPKYPRRVAVLTSPSGAAVKDILVTLARRGFNLEVIFDPVKVQGDGSAESIANGLRRVAAMRPAPDVIIVGRGGGSMEDLWAFNEEIVVRAISSCTIPVISAVGHETDTTLTDFVADLRAPTPTAAAELACADRFELSEIVQQNGSRLRRVMNDQLTQLKMRLDSFDGAYGLRILPDRLVQYEQFLDDAQIRMGRSLKIGLDRRVEKMKSLENNLLALSPKQVMKRGYAVVMKDGLPVVTNETVQPEDVVNIVFAEGRAEAEIRKSIRN